jgi:hypothetical protein
MILVTFHGGSKVGINNVNAYSSTDGSLEAANALQGIPGGVNLYELRAIVLHGAYLYVVSGEEKDSYVVAFERVPSTGPGFGYVSTVIGYGQSIMHPFGIVFDPSSSHCYVSNQDSNVVAQVRLKIGGKHVEGSLGSDCQSKYLNDKYHHHRHDFLDGTFVASQDGNLANVQKVAPDVSKGDGGLGVLPKAKGSKAVKPSNSVRDVAIADGILFVCDEVDSQINMYELKDGKFLGATAVESLSESAADSAAESAKKSSSKHMPTHLAIDSNGIWVSADAGLYWSELPTSASGAKLKFHRVAIQVPNGNKVGGISFDTVGSVYVVFQDGTGGQGTGSLEKYTVTAGKPPTLSHPVPLTQFTDDTPEFCLWLPDSSGSG